MSEYEKEFIKRVREEIATRALSQRAVRDLIGVSGITISKILNNQFNSMRADTMLKLAKLFEISLDEIITEVTNL